MNIGQSELAYKTPNGYLFVQESDEGYDFSLYDDEFNLVDGGQICSSEEESQIDSAAYEIMIYFGICDRETCPVDPGYVLDRVQESEANNERMQI